MIQLGVAALAPADVKIVKPEDYYGFIEPLLAVFCAFIAPELMGRDQRTKTLSLYFSRALRREDYALAKFAAMVTAMLGMTLLPQLLMFAGNMGASTESAATCATTGRISPRSSPAPSSSPRSSPASGSPSPARPPAAPTPPSPSSPLSSSASASLPLSSRRRAQRTGRYALLLSPFHVARGFTLWIFGSSPSSSDDRQLFEANLNGSVYALDAARHGRGLPPHHRPPLLEGLRMTDGAVPHGVVEATNVSRWYGNVVAVNDVSFSLGPGITGLLGPNGAGKSTILHMLAGFLKPSSGTVSIGGEPTWQQPQRLYRTTGLVPALRRRVPLPDRPRLRAPQRAPATGCRIPKPPPAARSTSSAWSTPRTASSAATPRA